MAKICSLARAQLRENKRVREFVGYAYKLDGLPARRICGSAADLKRDGLLLRWMPCNGKGRRRISY